MDLLDRLRPRWRHADPEVRLAAVRELDAADQDRLGTIVLEDQDARVRRVALKKIDDVRVLDRVASADADAGLRELAAERAREVRVRSASADGVVADCLAALQGVSDERGLGQVASDAAHAAVRAAALARIVSDRVLRDVVRGASQADVRRAALDRIADPSLLRTLATSELPPDLGVAAVERLVDPEALRAVVESRVAAKAARQRARAMLGLDAERAPGGPRDVRARQLDLCTSVEGLRTVSDVLAAGERAEAARREWQELGREMDPRPEVAQRFEAACEAVLARAASLVRRQAELEHAHDAVARHRAARHELCARVEALDGAEALDCLAAAEAEWDALPPLETHDASSLARRFIAATEACRERHARFAAREAIHAEVLRLADTADQLADAGGPPATKAWRALERQWDAMRDARAGLDDGPALDARFAAATERIAKRWQDDAEKRAEAERDNLKRLDALCTRLEALVTAEKLKVATGRRELQAAEAAMQGFGPLPPTEKRVEWTRRLTAARDELARRVAKESETEEWRRWANTGAQEELIARVEGLLVTEDLAEATRQLPRLQDEWAAIATATPERSQALWEQFRAARDQLRRRCDAYMAENLERKRALCARVADLGDSTEWNATADLIRTLQAEWKAIGPVPPRQSQALWKQFREPCDRFFDRRKAHFGQQDAERQSNAARKLALCERAEALGDSTDWDETANVLKQLQAEWKRSGPPPRDQAEVLWQRFRSACDRFFDRRNRREDIARDALLTQADALCERLEDVVASLEGDEPPDDARIGATLDEVWGEWLKLDLVTVPAAAARRERLDAAAGRIASSRPASLGGTRLDPATTRKRRETLCARLEALAAPAPAPAKAVSLQEMALALRDRLASNTIAAGGRKEPVRAPVDRAAEAAKIDAGWARLGPALDDEARALAERFAEARRRAGRGTEAS